MAKIINITDKLTTDKPKIIVGGKEYTVNNGMSTVLKFEELAEEKTTESMIKAVEIAIGEPAAKELDVKNMGIDNFKVLITAIMAASQGLEYEEAASRFQ